jgi:hypothetical protein
MARVSDLPEHEEWLYKVQLPEPSPLRAARLLERGSRARPIRRGLRRATSRQRRLPPAKTLVSCSMSGAARPSVRPYALFDEPTA